MREVPAERVIQLDPAAPPLEVDVSARVGIIKAAPWIHSRPAEASLARADGNIAVGKAWPRGPSTLRFSLPAPASFELPRNLSEILTLTAARSL